MDSMLLFITLNLLYLVNKEKAASFRSFFCVEILNRKEKKANG